MAPITATNMATSSLYPPGSNAMSSLLDNIQKLNIKENHNGGDVGAGVQNGSSRDASGKATAGKKVSFSHPPVRPVRPLSPVTNRNR